jgi:hypothetical protein
LKNVGYRHRIDARGEFKRRIERGMCAALRLDCLHALLELLAGGQILLRKVDGWSSVHVASPSKRLTLPFEHIEDTTFLQELTASANFH